MTDGILRTGIAGFGQIGERRKHHIDLEPDIRVVAVCDIKFDGPVPRPAGVHTYLTYEEMLGNEELDVLFVCLPNYMAPTVTIAGLERGLHVFCEKPPGRCVSDIERVIEAERAAPHLKLKYGFNHRYHDSVQTALKMVESGKFGKIVNMRGVYGKSAMIPWPRPQATGGQNDEIRNWRTSARIAGAGILLDQGIHMVDLMLAFAGRFTEIKSFVSNSYWQHDVEDNAFALMRTPEGVVGSLHSTATQWRHRFSLEIFLEEGALILTGILSGSRSYGNETLTVVYREDDNKGNPREMKTSYVRDHSWQREIREFVDAVLQDTKITIGKSAEALNSMKTVFAIYDADPQWQELNRTFNEEP